MNNERIAHMAEKIAVDEAVEAEVPDTPLEMVDQAMDTMIASLLIINEWLPKIEAQTVPQRAALDLIRSNMDEAVAPYLAEAAKAMSVLAQ